jgi:hypothetical protein
VFSENQRKTNETDRVLQFNDVLEFAMLSESDAGVLDYTTEKDESGRVIRRNFTDSTGIVRKSIERLDFNANDDPVTIKKKTFSASAKGESYKKHTVGYSVDGGVVSDAVVELPYEAVESVTTARNSITSDPVELYNPDSNIASFQANELVKRMPFRNVLANNMSSLEIIGNKMVEPFATGKDEYIDADGMPYVGGDTLDINYDFYTKTAGDTNPMKIYSANIDPSNPPAPTDLSWKEITDQATIDRLKLQNELPITSTDTTGRTAVYGGQNYVLQNSTNPAVRDDFAGKVAGDTAVNPNVAYRRAAMTTLQTPSMFTSGDELVNNNNYNGYGSLMVLNDSKTIFAMSPSSGQIPQILLSFDLIRIWEDKYDLIPIDRTGTADEVKVDKWRG